MVFIVLPVFYITYYVVFSAGVTRDIYYSILQTNAMEAIEFIRVNSVDKYLPVSIALICLVAFFLYRYIHRAPVVVPRHRQKLFLLCLLIAATGWSGQPRISKDMGAYTIKYYNRLRLFKRRTGKRDISKISYRASKAGKGETYLVAIGESLNRHHMQIYGYPRRTTPILATEKDLLIFNNVYSSNILTGLVLARALTASSQYNSTEWFQAISIVDVLRVAKIKTFWLSNQDLYGSWLSFGILLGKQTDHHLYLGDAFYESPHFDGVLLPHVARILKEETQDNRVIFVHLMGSHTDYCLRYSSTYARFKGKLAAATHGSLARTEVSHQQRINCYDNSVLYNDFVVSQLLVELKKYGGVTGFVYFSDHATDVLSGKKRITGGFNYEMTSIPMVAWFSPQYRKKYPQTYQILQNNSTKLFSGDMLYDTLIGIMAINTNQYEPRNDLSSPTYELKDDKALVLNGQYKYNDNIYWQQKKRIAALNTDGDGSRAIPARVNSVGELKEVWRDGSRSFAIDLTDKDTCFTVGRSDMCWQDFLSHVDTSKIEKLWFNVKIVFGEVKNNLQKIKNNVPTAKIIVDIGVCSDDAKILAQHGWQLSCTLSPSLLQSLATEDNAAALVEQLNKRGVSALSFDARFYPQVKENFDHLLPAGFAFHLRSPAGVDRVRKAAYWSDPRVETVAFRYHSLFQLPVKTKPKTYAAKKLPQP